MRVKVFTKRTILTEVVEHQTMGIYHQNCLDFFEEDAKVSLDFSKKQMIREDSQKKLVYNFLEKCETVNDVFIKDLNQHLDLAIFTEKFEPHEKSFILVYDLLLEKKKVTYEVRWEDAK